MTRGQGDFSTELLVHTVRKDKQLYKAALATIDQPGDCDKCHALGVVKRWKLRRGIVSIRT